MAEAKEGEEHRSLNELASAIAECVDRHEQPPYAVQEWSNVGSCGESNLRHPAERNMCFCPLFFSNVVASSRFPCGYLCTFLCLHLVCRAFRNTGRCRYGDECNYEHSEGDPIEPPPRGQCFNWKQTGECDYGDNCRFLHGDDDDGSRFKKKEVRSTQCCSRTGSSYSCSVARALGASVLWYLAIRFVY